MAERYGAVRTRRECAEESARVRTMYKRKDKKVNPVDAPLPNGVNPGGRAIRRGSVRNELGYELHRAARDRNKDTGY
jgi:hypothetical protein